MKYIGSYISILVVLFLISCSRALFKTVIWQATPIVIDGTASEWDVLPAMYDNNSKLMYEIRNDQEYVYLAIRTSDRFSQMKILSGGLQLGLDTSDKEIFPLKIYFPWQKTVGLPSPSPSSDAGQFPKLPLDSSPNRMRIEGFGEMDGIYEGESRNGIQAAIGGDLTEFFFLEFKIPFTTFIGNHLDASDTLKVISMELLLPLLEMPDGAQQMNPDREGGPPEGLSSGPPPDMAGGNGPPPMTMGSFDLGQKTLRIRFHPVFAKN